ncbi:hypothetical protein M3194_24260 [Paenibacillus glycanilyticus]|uniref:hypothetical protein n=1 Tax=Paenibacillus glycanilyticus TaxID=126569 RepID=UPI00203FA9A9|nr:hypothetical protein [Paenibacillus glycanilyticus]MCM3630451.1 hypothetical protein [Paenibacillus glycanilyticus]
METNNKGDSSLRELSESAADEGQLLRSLYAIRQRSCSDFAAYASSAEFNLGMKWSKVHGSLNGKVEHMKIQPGIGIGGMVLRHGTVFAVDEKRNAAMLRECPVMLAEKLISAIGVPVSSAGYTHSMNGILLLGRRSNPLFTEEEIQGLSSFLAEKGDNR